MASGADHISDLPEGVFHHILSLLPAHDAVRTCVLAHRWRDLWRSAPAVRIVGCRDWPGGIEAFGRFVDGLLRHRRGGAPLESCGFDLDLEVDPSDLPAVEQQGNSCIRRALRRKVRELRFDVSVQITPRLLFTLSDRPLASEHLTRLELAGVQGNAGVLDFSWCPALEELKMVECSVGSLAMHSPSVKHLSIKINGSYPLIFVSFS
ncbi:hypothetical protein QOZ80_9BG0700170 [Eleusine coracana subsp. coracana]|nr:hypothetical protein QOZ80_9BG0700170 [Eleusine coracana subsp. coracana]